ncbi:MAG: fused MFS/spermidine synthase [Rhodocyclaceae bacterium]|nr:fused MFS/spermidine synthase [Rhodocyclaceae bacterium]
MSDSSIALRPPVLVALLYGGTIFFSAFLLFQLQPLAGKAILPWFGGSASVWTCCLLFFQAVLLLGYSYSHWLGSRLQPRTQAIVHTALLLCAAITLNVLPDAHAKPVDGGQPVLRILVVLASTVGLPFFALSTTGPLVQAWFARERPGSLPYRLFALSNLGSMLALLGYPAFIEPYARLDQQARLWSMGFVLFCAAGAALVWRSARLASATYGRSTAVPEPLMPGMRLWLLWAGLAACPSILLVATTSYLTQNIVPIPLLWVLPLALYLLSFILCFEHPRWYWRRSFALMALVGLCLLAWLPTLGLSAMDIRLRVGAYLLILLVLCMSCHGELYRLKPHPRHLTGFYLMLAAGGSAGGIFVGLIAPLVFRADFDLSIGLALTAAALAVALIASAQGCLPVRTARHWRLLLAAVVASGISVALFWDAAHRVQGAVALDRNFYGALRVSDASNGNAAVRTLSHGRIIHGQQIMSPDRLRWPTTYYAEQSGAGVALRLTQGQDRQRVGLIGLGVGTVLSYMRAQDYYRVYEINPLVVQFARRYFTYLADARGHFDIVEGDARLMLERDLPQAFDTLIVDAFSGDSVPAHLLTREAFALYAAHLAPGGVIAVHVSNKYVDLAPVVRLAAEQIGYSALAFDSRDDYAKAIYGSNWVLVAKDSSVLVNAGAPSKEIPVRTKLRPWTDDYSSLLPLLK